MLTLAACSSQKTKPEIVLQIPSPPGARIKVNSQEYSESEAQAAALTVAREYCQTDNPILISINEKTMLNGKKARAHVRGTRYYVPIKMHDSFHYFTYQCAGERVETDKESDTGIID